MTARDLACKLLQLDPALAVRVWDSKANRFREFFALSATLFDELLVTPISPDCTDTTSDLMKPPEPRSRLHFGGIIWAHPKIRPGASLQ